jgi:hypothetical protein
MEYGYFSNFSNQSSSSLTVENVVIPQGWNTGQKSITLYSNSAANTDSKDFYFTVNEALKKPVISSVSPSNVFKSVPVELEIFGSNFNGANAVQVKGYGTSTEYNKTYTGNELNVEPGGTRIIIPNFTLNDDSGSYEFYVKNPSTDNDKNISDAFIKYMYTSNLSTPDLYVSYAKATTTCKINGDDDPTNYRDQDTMTIRFKVANRGTDAQNESTATVRFCDNKTCSGSSNIITTKSVPSMISQDEYNSEFITYTNHPSWFNEGDLAYVVIEADSNNTINEGAHEDKNSKAVPIRNNPEEEVSDPDFNCGDTSASGFFVQSIDPNWTAPDPTTETYADLSLEIFSFLQSVKKGDISAFEIPVVAGRLHERLENWKDIQSVEDIATLDASLFPVKSALLLLSNLPEAEEVEVIIAADGTTEMVPVVERASEILIDSERAFEEESELITADSFLATGWNDDGLGGIQPLSIIPQSSFTDADFLESVQPSTIADSDDFSIRALAQELEYDPVLIQKWVQENIVYIPYAKSLQGASGCLSSKQCNDTDVAHLLVALFRASEIPARYHEQRLSIPFDIYRNMLGAESNEIALNIAKEFESGKDPKAVLQNGNEVSLESVSDANSVESIAINTVWAEAYLPYAAEQSATGIITPAGVEGISELTTNAEVLSALDDGQRRLWIPFSLLGSERVLQNTPQFAPQNHTSRLSDFVLEFLSTPTKKSPSEILDGIFGITETNQSSYLPAFTQTAANTGGLLPTTLPGIASGDAFLSPAIDHHSTAELRIFLENESGAEVFAYQESTLANTSDADIEIRFLGATSADSTTIENRGSIYNLTPAELNTVKIVPVLYRDGEEISRGNTPLSINEILTLSVSLERGQGATTTILAKENGVILAGADTGIASFTGVPEFVPEYHLSQGLSDLAKHLLYRESEEKAY